MTFSRHMTPSPPDLGHQNDENTTDKKNTCRMTMIQISNRIILNCIKKGHSRFVQHDVLLYTLNVYIQVIVCIRVLAKHELNIVHVYLKQR